MKDSQRKEMQEFVEKNRNMGEKTTAFRYTVKVDLMWQRQKHTPHGSHPEVMRMNKYVMKIVCPTPHITDVIDCIEKELAREYGNADQWGYEVVSIKYKGMVNVLDN